MNAFIDMFYEKYACIEITKCRPKCLNVSKAVDIMSSTPQPWWFTANRKNRLILMSEYCSDTLRVSQYLRNDKLMF